MPFCGFVLTAIVDELKNKLKRGVVTKIHQPHSRDIIFIIKNNGEKFNLLLSSDPKNSRICITSSHFENPKTPFDFCLVLRKHLTNAHLVEINQIGTDRICEFCFENFSEIGDKVEFSFYVEVMGRNSNIILTKNNKIIDSIVRVGPAKSRIRQVSPHLDYHLPPRQFKLSPFVSNFELEDIFNKFLYQNNILNIKLVETKLINYIVQTFEGISPLIAKEISHQHLTKNKDFKNIKKTFSEFMKPPFNKIFFPNVVIQKNNNKIVKLIDFSCLELTQYNGFETKIFKTMSEAIDFYYNFENYEIHETEQYRNLAKIIKQNIFLIEKKIEIHKKILSECQEKDFYKKCGDLLVCNLHRLKTHLSEVEVKDLYNKENKSLIIKLDPKYSVSVNMGKYYKKYNKLKTAQKVSQGRIQIYIEEKYYLDSILNHLENCEKLSEIDEIEEKLKNLGYIKNQQKGKTNKNKLNQKEPRFRNFISPSGFEILVGNNNKQNEYLTFKYAKDNDIWFHTRSIPGAHVILKINKTINSIKDADIVKSAAIAAFYSTARHSEKVEVDYTNISNVKKIKNSKPGMVTYTNQKTICIKPSLN